MFWVWTVGAFLVMMGVLTVAQDYALELPSWLLDGKVGGIFAFSVIAVCVGVSLWVLWRASIGWVTRFLLGVVLWAMAMFMVGIYTYHKHHQFEQHRPKFPLQITATAELLELSDSVYNPAFGEPYRQKAILTDIRLATTTLHHQVPNPFFNPTADQQLAVARSALSADLPKTLTVLLYAPAHNPSKQRPTDNLLPLSELKVGNQVKVKLRLEPLLERNQTHFDEYRWLSTRHIQAKARVLAVSEVSPVARNGVDGVLLSIQKWRQRYRTHFYENFWGLDHQKAQAAAITLSLLTGDRALIDKEITQLYQYAGILHLLAISGTHVLFLAVLLAGGVTAVVNRFFVGVYQVLPRWQLRFWVMVAAALLYALFTGFEVPAVRTVLMLVATGVVRYLLMDWSGFRVLVVTGLLMAFFDPFVLWQAGFWLSFVAVAILMGYETHTQSGTPSLGVMQRVLVMVRLQLYVFVAILPISLLLFGRVSWLGMLVNLGAVGLFGWLIVPMNLVAGLLYVVVPSVSDGLWAAVIWLLDGLNGLLTLMQLLFDDVWLVAPMSLTGLLLFMLTLILAGNQVLPRRLAIVPMLALLLALVSPSGAVPTIKVLPVQTPTLGAVVVDNEWLVLSLSAHAKIDDEKLADGLQMALGQAQISKLTGIVIQNGDTKSQEVLGRAAGRLSQRMPIHKLYWAGQATRFGGLYAQRCQAGLMIESANSRLDVLTGWQEVADESVHDCAVLVSSPLAGKVVLATGQDENWTGAVLIENAHSERLWDMYALMCQHEPLSSVTPALLLTHNQSRLSTRHHQMFAKPKTIVMGADDGRALHKFGME